MKVILRLVAASLLLVTSCSSHATGTAPGPASVTFQSGMTPGMSGMPAMPSQPLPTSATATESPTPHGATSVSISDFKFDPASLTVPVGATVTWTNKDEEPHTVAANDGSFHSPGMDTNATYSFTFTTPGSYDYICSIHPFMTGTVVVTK